MKTTSIITVSGAIAVILLALIKISGGSFEKFEKVAPAHVKEKSHSTAKKNNATLVDFLPMKYEHNSTPIHVEPVDAIAATRLGSAKEDAKTDGDLRLDEIVFIEEEVTFDLGFDVAEYLPADFNPYASSALTLEDIVFIEKEEEIELGFDTEEYLPIVFNAYATAHPDLSAIEFIEVDELELGFDTSAYLPVGFDPYAKPESDLQTIVFIEEETAVELDFDVNAYLPADFDPYAPAAFDLDQINFIEEEEEIDLWKETSTNVVF